MKIPESLAWIAARRPDVQEFVSVLPDRIRDLEERWSIRVGEPFDPGGFTSYTARAVKSNGEHCVLKLAYEWESTRLERDALRAWNGDGVVRLLEDEPFTMLLEACEPGEPLYTEPDVDIAESVAIRILKQMWRPAPPDIDWRSVDVEASGMAATIEANHVTSNNRVDPAHVRFAQEFLASAAEYSGPVVLLHGDFHQGNVLSAQRDGWLAIDPSPLVGDQCFDAARAVIETPTTVLASSNPVQRVSDRIQRFANELGLDRYTLAAWALTRCIYIVLLPVFDTASWSQELNELVPLLAHSVDY